MREIDRQLFKAIQKNKPLREIKKIIKKGANVNVQDEYGKTPLMYAINYKKYKIDLISLFYYSYNIRLLKFLLKNGANVNLQDNKGNTLFFYSLNKVFISKNIKKNKFFISKNIKNFLQTLRFNIERIINYFEKRKEKKFFYILLYILYIVYFNTLRLILGIIKLHSIFVTTLYKSNYYAFFLRVLKKSNLCIKNKNNISPFEYLIFEYLFYDKCPFAIKSLLFQGENLKQNFIDYLFKTYTICINNKNLLRYLYKKRIFNKKSSKLIDIIRILILSFNLDINEKIDNKTLLEIALEERNIELAKFLIKEGANVNIILDDGKSLLEFAEYIKDNELINLIKNSPIYKPLDHNPKKLVKILTNFRKDSPIKYTTHLWDFNFKEEYGDFKNYLREVKKQWDEIEKELKELSSNIHRKIKLFLFAKDEKETWSSVEGDKLAVGWSNLNGLEDWCNSGKNPFDFPLEKKFKIEGKTLSKFGDVINVFKREIQIRSENNHLENIILDFEEKIYEKNENFEIQYEKLRGKSFYTDVEIFKKILDKIFSEMLKRKEYPEILIEAKNDNENYFDLTITQKGSFSYLSPDEMLKKGEGGDFADIKRHLKNLCDWSIENKDSNGKSYRVNYLISTPKERIEKLDYDIEGFTHILRFYK